jgi:hypothetical protein
MKMYINTCVGGYPCPITKGVPTKIEVLGVRATVSDPTAVSRITLVDDIGKLRSDTAYDVTIVDCKGMANADANIEVLFPEPLKTRNGVAATDITNLIQGSILLYVR